MQADIIEYLFNPLAHPSPKKLRHAVVHHIADLTGSRRYALTQGNRSFENAYHIPDADLIWRPS